MIDNLQVDAVTIPYRKIICKSCMSVGDTQTGFKIFDSETKGRALAVCDQCGTQNLIKKERNL